MTDEAPQNQAPADAGQAADAGQGATPQVNQAQWFDSFQNEDLGFIQNKGWNKPEGVKDMLTSYRNLEKLRGVPEDKLLKIPDAEDKSGWDKVYSKLGKPEVADNYKFEVPEGQQADTKKLDWFKGIAHNLNLTDKQYAGIAESVLNYENEANNAYETEQAQIRTEALDKLKTDWGKHYDERVELAARAVKAFVKNTEVVDKLESLIGTETANADVIRLFADIGAKIGETNAILPDNERKFGYTREQALEDIRALKAEIKADPKRLDVFNKNSNGPDNIKLERLNKIAFGGE